MADYWVTYRDVADFPRKSFEVMAPPPPGGQRIKPGVLPGQHGYRDMYIDWHEREFGSDTVHLVTYTEAPVSDRQANGLMKRALQIAREG